MALHSLPSGLGQGGTGLHGDGGVVLGKALRQLQTIKTSVVAGNVAANTNMALADAAVADTIVSVMEQDTTSGVLAAHAGTVTVYAAGQIRSTAVTTGKNLIVTWVKA